MPIATMPRAALDRIKPRLTTLSKRVDVRIFAARTAVPALVFTQAEIDAFGGDTGETMVVAVPDLEQLTAAIPPQEDDRLNYIVLTHPRAVARLDPFAK